MRKLYADADYFQSRATINTRFATVIQGGAMTWVTLNTCMNNGTAQQSPAAMSDEFRVPVALRRGTYNFNVVFLRNTDCGQIAFTMLGDTPERSFTIGGTNELYGSLLPNQIISISFSLPYTYDWLIDCSVVGKHASSSSYKVPVSHMEIVRTGD
jgi:hypothetical protein